ncbi:Na(+)/H(+) antiporter subunit A [Maioricimonas rarisocia]|uniref:Na(+)/H(+) antiporter subunit A n=1 Tax=Maioricimonas rarisocia TaxID=2528026 RepID=A0A517Z0M8_9PLAN|nr:hydrogen gas-evolving membrane-bound hydrogenase subunit E [Maioricimonas rarisocia]QDU35979.1 Na(+)/H(+) antiporter subunit A [Maioricimonas rarisocia]
MFEWLLAIFIAGLLAPLVVRMVGSGSGWLLSLVPAIVFVALLGQIAPISNGEFAVASLQWVPELNLAVSLRLDGLALLFALLITGIGAVILVYAGSYLHGDDRLGQLLSLLLLFMGSMLGLVLANNVFALYVFWELTSITSYLLIGFNNRNPVSRASALQALLVTGSGGLALLPGLILLGIAGETFSISELSLQSEAIREHAFYLPALLLVLAGAFTKSAQFPFHFWLPNAMAAPTPISAYLHSATMVKAGVYLLARLHPALGGTPEWFWLIVPVGAVTTMLGAVLAVRAVDLKQILAYATISVLGALTMLLGTGSEDAIVAALALLVAHALYKGALFMVAGAIDHSIHQRAINRLGGLRRRMPATMVAAGMAGLSMVGLVPLFGFVAKELYYESLGHGSVLPGHASVLGSWLATWGMVVLLAVAVGSNILLVAAAGLVCVTPFAGPVTPETDKARDGSIALWAPAVILGFASLLLGLQPVLLDQLLAAGSGAITGQPIELHLAVWHGINTTLILSVFTLAAGIVLYVNRHRLEGVLFAPEAERSLAALQWLAKLAPSRCYEWLLASTIVFARQLTRGLQNGYLSMYLLAMIAATVFGVWLSLPQQVFPSLELLDLKVRPHEALLALLILIAAVTAVCARTWLLAVGSLGVVGFGVAGLFVLFGAPDLAMTQFVIETLTVILFVLAFSRLPDFRRLSNTGTRARDAFIATVSGGTITVLLLFAITVRSDHPISTWYAEHSVKEAHGRNLVNVILVDFRALDTLGEITVLSIAAIGVYSLVTLRASGPASRTNAGVHTDDDSEDLGMS